MSSDFDKICFLGVFQHAEFNAAIYSAAEAIFYASNSALHGSKKGVSPLNPIKYQLCEISFDFDEICIPGVFQHAELNAAIYLAVERIFYDSNLGLYDSKRGLAKKSENINFAKYRLILMKLVFLGVFNMLNTMLLFI